MLKLFGAIVKASCQTVESSQQRIFFLYIEGQIRFIPSKIILLITYLFRTNDFIKVTAREMEECSINFTR